MRHPREEDQDSTGGAVLEAISKPPIGPADFLISKELKWVLKPVLGTKGHDHAD
jgi:hypothetical protein